MLGISSKVWIIVGLVLAVLSLSVVLAGFPISRSSP
jgi:hypothetical protein